MRLAAFLLLAAAVFPQRHVTQGRAQTITENQYKCPETVNNHRIATVGRITATDGAVFSMKNDWRQIFPNTRQ